MASSPVPLGQVFADKYRVDRVLGEGGMGIVVAAHHLELDQPVAIKFLLDDVASHEEGAERFRREARAAAKIQSDHVVRVLDVGILPTRERYMVMEYLEGRDLAEEIAVRRTFPIGVAAGFVLEALDAVGHAHQVGIVHRDLKPANLFLARRPDGSQRIKVLDFGISKSMGGTTSELSLTKTSAWIGSPLYMAPEQMQSARDVDHRADIWSLGAILYELIVGHPPYQAESLPQLCNLLITSDPVPITELVPGIPEGLAAAIMGCLVRDRAGRTQSTNELAAVLLNYATSITGSARRFSMVERTEFGSDAVDARASAGVVATLGLTGQVASELLASKEARAPAASREAIAGATVTGGTHVAWDAAAETKAKGGSKLGLLIAAALLAAGAIGFFAMRGGDAGREAAAAAPAAAEPSEDRAPVEAAAEPAPPSPAVAPVGSEPKEELPTQAEAPVQASPAAPQVAPVVKKPVGSSRPQSAPTEDLSDFGGRR